MNKIDATIVLMVLFVLVPVMRHYNIPPDQMLLAAVLVAINVNPQKVGN